MDSILAAVKYKDADLIEKVREAANKKFGGNSYVKNLWILKEYKKRGGKVSYKGKKPSQKSIEKQTAGVSIDDEILKMVDEFEETDDQFEARMYAESEIEDENESLAMSEEKISEVYKKYHSLVNMSYSQLKNWSENPCSKVASLSRSPINRNLKLLSKSKDQWTATDTRSANRTISFISRMKGVEGGENTKTADGKSCPSKKSVSLMNWGYKP